MTDDELAAVEARANGATNPPWYFKLTSIETQDGKDVVALRSGKYSFGFEYLYISDEDGAFIAAARSDVPALVAEVRRLQEENTMLQCAWLLHETIQPDGELAATLTDVVRENERLRDVLDQIANAGQWSPYHGRDLAAWMATTARVALGEQGYAK